MTLWVSFLKRDSKNSSEKRAALATPSLTIKAKVPIYRARFQDVTNKLRGN